MKTESTVYHARYYSRAGINNLSGLWGQNRYTHPMPGSDVGNIEPYLDNWAQFGKR